MFVSVAGWTDDPSRLHGPEVSAAAVEATFLSREEAEGRLTSDDGVFMPHIGYLSVHSDQYGRLPAVLIDFPAMAAKVRDGSLRSDRHGIGNEIEGVETELFAYFRTSLCALYVWLTNPPDGWVEIAMKQFAVAFQPDPKIDEPGTTPYIASGEMLNFGPKGLVLTPKDRGDEMVWRSDRAPGRNDPCECGSGKKFKHCHGQ